LDEQIAKDGQAEEMSVVLVCKKCRQQKIPPSADLLPICPETGQNLSKNREFQTLCL
jgi:hypothetical protein